MTKVMNSMSYQRIKVDALFFCCIAPQKKGGEERTNE